MLMQSFRGVFCGNWSLVVAIGFQRLFQVVVLVSSLRWIKLILFVVSCVCCGCVGSNFYDWISARIWWLVFCWTITFGGGFVCTCALNKCKLCWCWEPEVAWNVREILVLFVWVIVMNHYWMKHDHSLNFVVLFIFYGFFSLSLSITERITIELHHITNICWCGVFVLLWYVYSSSSNQWSGVYKYWVTILWTEVHSVHSFKRGSESCRNSPACCF